MIEHRPLTSSVVMLGLLWMGTGLSADDREREAICRYPFAMCTNGHMLNNSAYPGAMLDTGARMCRLDVSFASVRAKPGDNPEQWNWSSMEKMRALRTAHPDLQCLAILGYNPSWAEDPAFKDKPGGRLAGPPQGVDIRPVEDPRNLFGHYVSEIVRRYKDVTSFWESWNEPDLPGHHYFKGSGRDFFKYQRVLYLAAKKADPGCTVLGPGLCFPTPEGYLNLHQLKPPTPSPSPTCFFEEFLQACAEDPEAEKNNFYFDVASQHSYSRASDLYDYTAILQKLMRDHLKQVKPVWITEMGSTDKPGGSFGLSPDEYCDYMLQSYAWGALAGVQKFFHFQLDNTNGHGLYARGFGDPKPALTTYRDVLVRNFADAVFVRQVHGTAGVGFLEGRSPYTGGGRDGYDLFEFKSRDGGRRMFIAFSDTAKAVTIRIPATKTEAALIDRHNNRREIQAQDGAYVVELPGATNVAGWPVSNNPKAQALGEPEHLVGGATLVLVEP